MAEGKDVEWNTQNRFKREDRKICHRLPFFPKYSTTFTISCSLILMRRPGVIMRQLKRNELTPWRNILRIGIVIPLVVNVASHCHYVIKKTTLKVAAYRALKKNCETGTNMPTEGKASTHNSSLVQKITVTLFGTVVHELGIAVPCIVTPATRRCVAPSLPKL